MIDKAYASKLASSIQKELFRRISATFICDTQARLISDFEAERRNLLGEGVAKLWDKLMSKYGAYDQRRTLLVSEKALACLIRRGAPKNNITMTGTSAKVRLNNCLYYVDKEGAGCSAGPCGFTGWRNKPPMRWVTLSGEDFADFVFEFDELVTDFARGVDEQLLGVRIKAAQYEILSQSANQLGELFLKPQGITWHISTDFTDSDILVEFRDAEHQPLHEVIPMDKLTDVFQSIPEKMNSQPLFPTYEKKGYL